MRLRLFLLASLLPSSLFAASATRSFSPTSYTNGSPISVSLSVIPDTSTVNYIVEDDVPLNWDYVVGSAKALDSATGLPAAGDQGSWNPGIPAVQWGLYGDNAHRIFSYQITPQTNQAGVKTFSGLAGFVDSSSNQKILSIPGNIGPTINASTGALNVTINTLQKVKITLNPTTPRGRPARLDGKPAWIVLAGDSTLDVSPDALSAFLISGPTATDSLFQVSADVDLTSNISMISQQIYLHVINPPASLTVGQPQPK